MSWTFTIALVAYALVASIYIRHSIDVNLRDEHLSPLGQICKLTCVILMIVVLVLGFIL